MALSKQEQAKETLFKGYAGISRNLRIGADGTVRFGNGDSLTPGRAQAILDLAGVAPPKPKTRRVKVVEKVIVPPAEIIREQALEALPGGMNGPRKFALDAMCDPFLDDGVVEMMGRAAEMRHPVTALLAGIGMHAPSRHWWEDSLDQMWATTNLKLSYPEVIVGSGIHAAIYCAVRHKMGFSRPLVIEQRERAGGSFAITRNPAFFLNSRNRAGELSVPGDLKGALNVLPGAMLQPSDLSSAEYITNDVLAFAIRAALAMYADVITGRAVKNIFTAAPRNKYKYVVDFGSGEKVGADRVISATGLGVEERPLFSPMTMTFGEFMRRFDDPFPLRGMERVAVIGAGDSGKTAIEALTGQGPQPNMSVASLDTPQMIDWYGVGATMNCQTWQEANRTRFKRIGKLLPGAGVGEIKVRPFNLASTPVESFERMVIGANNYTHVISCIGSTPEQFDRTFGMPLNNTVNDISGQRAIARCNAAKDVFSIGVVSQLPPDLAEITFTQTIGENATSIFRYASRSAKLAAMLLAP